MFTKHLSHLLSENNQSEFRDKDLVLVMEKENYYDGAAKVAEIDLITKKAIIESGISINGKKI